ncbi:hypothetical protein C8R44DRAFT_866095 [Mycena epipterygia]|nr:hypothetical protein C8R44DRAFT_866095 [Mycena epipterygia]
MSLSFARPLISLEKTIHARTGRLSRELTKACCRGHTLVVTPAPSDSTRTLLLLYKQPHVYKNAPQGLLCPVGVRVQGFIDKCNLKPLGNWTKDSLPQTALQSITLSGGLGHQPLFDDYKAAVDEVVAFIYRALNSAPVNNGRPTSDSLYATRRVFTKITGRNRDAPSVLSAGDDPMLLCDAIRNTWRVTEKARVGMYVENVGEVGGGSRVPCEPLLLAEGDFVDVCVGFDIVTRYNRSGAQHQVHLTIEHVLLLTPAAENIPMDVEPQSVHIQGPGLDF